MSSMISHASRTKIVATIGPGILSATSLSELSEAGMSIARLNGSHGDKDWHANAIRLIRETLPDAPILFDLPGNKIRVLRLGAEVPFAAGDRVSFTGRPDAEGNPNAIPVDNSELHEILAPGMRFLIDDGRFSFRVETISGTTVHALAETSGAIRSRKGINIPSAASTRAGLSAKDRDWIAFAAHTGVDFIGVSFVSSGDHVDEIRAAIAGSVPRIVAKIENQPGLDHAEEIITRSDGIMIDRGDLSAETSVENVVLHQKRILELARKAARPVIVATEFLHSMIEDPLPTKAEVSDISNAVLDGAAALMLSGETAIGRYPVQAVAMMRRVAAAAEQFSHAARSPEAGTGAGQIPSAMGEAIALLCRRLPVSKIVAITIGGYSARAVSSFLPEQPIVAVSNNLEAARSFNLFAGVRGVFVDVDISARSLDHLPKCLRKLWEMNEITDDDVILVTGAGFPKSGNRMNFIETHKVSDLRDSLGWTR